MGFCVGGVTIWSNYEENEIWNIEGICSDILLHLNHLYY